MPTTDDRMTAHLMTLKNKQTNKLRDLTDLLANGRRYTPGEYGRLLGEVRSPVAHPQPCALCADYNPVQP